MSSNAEDECPFDEQADQQEPALGASSATAPILPSADAEKEYDIEEYYTVINLNSDSDDEGSGLSDQKHSTKSKSTAINKTIPVILGFLLVLFPRLTPLPFKTFSILSIMCFVP